MSTITYPITVDQPMQHRLAYPDGGAVRVNNESQYFAYVSIGSSVTIQDIKAGARLIIPPYAARTLIVQLFGQVPYLSIVALAEPYALDAPIGTNNRITLTEVIPTLVKAEPPGGEPLGGEPVISDLIIVAGGAIELNQSGIFARDNLGNPAFALNLSPSIVWDGLTLGPGDMVIGRGAQRVRWVNALGSMFIGGSGAGLINIPGGQIDAGTVGSGQLAAGSVIAGKIAANAVTAGTIAANAVTAGTIAVDAVTADKINVTQLSAIAADLGAVTAGTVTGATLRTNAATVPDVKMDASGVHILADNAGYLRWLASTGAEIVKIVGWSVVEGSADNLLSFLVNSQRASPGGELFVKAFGPNVNTEAGFSARSRNTATDYAIVAVVDSVAQVTAVRVTRNQVNITGSPTAATFAGLAVAGSSGRVPAEDLDVAGNILASGQFKIIRNAATLQGYLYVPLLSPLTSASYDGNDTVTANTTTTIDAVAVFGAPVGVKALMIRMSAVWTGAGTTRNLQLRPVGAALAQSIVRSQVANVVNDTQGIVNCDANGRFDLFCAAGENAGNVSITIWGYWI